MWPTEHEIIYCLGLYIKSLPTPIIDDESEAKEVK